MYEIPVLINIYRNKDRVRKLFSSLELVKPQTLYIFQDGGDDEKTRQQLDDCLRFAKQLVTWECDISTLRLETDIGPAAAEYYAHKWLFEKQKYGIIIEDDLVPSYDFFVFAKKMLIKYENNPKISYVSGTNPYGVYDCNYDYFFSTRGSLYCWATWKRFVDTYDANYSWIDSPNIKELMISTCCDRYSYKKIVSKTRKLIIQDKADFEIIVCMATIVNGQYAIVPAKNLVSNHGVDASSVNGAKTLFLMPREDQKAYFAPTYSINSDLKGPITICEETGYRKIYNQNLLKRVMRFISSKTRRLFYPLFILLNKKS